MKITYNVPGQEPMEIEVSEEVGEFIETSGRKEGNLSRKERRHCYSLDALVFEGEEYASDETPESIFEKNELKRTLETFMAKLTDKQRNRLKLLAQGYSMREISRLEKVDIKQVRKSIDGARKKFFESGPQNVPEMSVY